MKTMKAVLSRLFTLGFLFALFTYSAQAQGRVNDGHRHGGDGVIVVHQGNHGFHKACCAQAHCVTKRQQYGAFDRHRVGQKMKWRHRDRARTMRCEACVQNGHKRKTRGDRKARGRL